MNKMGDVSLLLKVKVVEDVKDDVIATDRVSNS
jgi:hypothetical protein